MLAIFVASDIKAPRNLKDSYYHTDHLGSTRLVTDSSKNIVAAVSYHPFGEPYVKEGTEDYLFAEKEKYATGLYYYGARYYDSEVSKFITRDAWKGDIWNPRTLNRFEYCYNNPLCYLDPDGNAPKHVIDGCDAPQREPPPDPGDQPSPTIFTIFWEVLGAGLILYWMLTHPVAAGIVGLVGLICWFGNWLIDLVNDRLFLDPMYEVEYQGYLPIYEDGPEWCTIIVHRDNFARSFLVTIYDSQGNLVAMWTRDEGGKIISGWMMVRGKYYIYLIFDSSDW